MKKYFLALTILLFVPVSVFAAFDDVTLTTDAVINVDSTNLNVSGSSAEIESITVNPTNFTVTLQTGSTFTVSSADRTVILSSTAGTVDISRTCTDSEATISLSGGSGVTVTLSIGSPCTVPVPSTGGGGGIFTQPVGIPLTGPALSAESATPAEPSEEPATPATPGKVAQPSVVAQLVSPVFNRTLKPGMSHVDVKRLQQLLNTNSDTQVAQNGAGSPGNETSYYGPLTTKAIQKFQAKYSIVSSGSPESTGYGQAGPKTRTKFSEVFKGAGTQKSSVAESTNTKREELQAQIDALKAQLAEILKQFEALQ